MEGTNVTARDFWDKIIIKKENLPKKQTQHSVNINFYNNLNVQVYIGTRDGDVYELDPIRENDSKVQSLFYIEREIINRSAKRIAHPYHVNGDNGVYSGIVESGPGLNQKGYEAFRVFNVLSLADLEAADALYFESIDYVISLKPTGWTHPRVVANTPNYKTRNNDGESESSIKFELVDRGNYYGTSYINVNGSVHRIKPITKMNRDEGLYVYFNSVLKDGKYREEDVIHIPLDKILDSQWKLYSNYQDALILGDYKRQKEDLREELKLEREEEILKLKHEVEIAKQETATIKEEHRRKEAEDELARTQSEKELSEIKRALTSEQERWAREKADLLHQQQMERSRLEHELSMRTSYRKDSSEALKWILGITGTVLSIFAMIMSQRKD